MSMASGAGAGLSVEIRVGQGGPVGIEALLSELGFEVRPNDGHNSPGITETDGFRVEFDRPSASDQSEAITVDLASGRSPLDVSRFEAPNAIAAATFILSRALHLPTPLLSSDPAMFDVIRAAIRGASTDSPMILMGETGTGKELMVRLAHTASGRPGSLLSLNCAALNDRVPERYPASQDDGIPTEATRLEELFSAADSTLLLDQVAELSPDAQAWMLAAIAAAGCEACDGGAGPDDRGGLRRGARLVAATNRPLPAMIHAGRFRRELYDRLAVLTIALPPLRERRGDIAMLARYFLHSAAPELDFAPAALKSLAGYPFPGNVRELMNLVTRLVIMPRPSADGLLHAADIRSQMTDAVLKSSAWKSIHLRFNPGWGSKP